MKKPIMPSPMIESFVENVREKFPSNEVLKLKEFEARIEATSSTADAHRARRCLEWAIDMAAKDNHSQSRWNELKELHQSWKDTWFALEFGVVAPQGAGHHPWEDAHIQWVENAVNVAKAAGEDDGWKYVPWDDLLSELIEMELMDPKNRGS
jgi:hypothetical protein